MIRYVDLSLSHKASLVLLTQPLFKIRFQLEMQQYMAKQTLPPPPPIVDPVPDYQMDYDSDPYVYTPVLHAAQYDE